MVGPEHLVVVYQVSESPASGLPTYIIKLEDAKVGEHLTLLQDFVGCTQKLRLLEVLFEDHRIETSTWTY